MIAVTREERDVLRREVGSDLGGIEDLVNTWDRGCPGEHLAHMRHRYHRALWLADDLGWDRDDPREMFFVTVPVDQFVAWLRECDAASLETLDSARDQICRAEHYATHHPVTVAELVSDGRTGADHALDQRRIFQAVLARIENDSQKETHR